MTAAFERIAVLGLGLLGGSVALAARASGVSKVVAGATRREDVIRRARACGAIDEAGSPEDVVAGAELVVLATPIHAMPALVERIAPHLEAGAIVTDVGSVKGGLETAIPALLPPHATFVGSHPMAGSHEQGFECARADLFRGARCIVVDSAAPEPVAAVAGFWKALGGCVVLRDARRHDVDVAWISHAPHAVAFAFAGALAGAPESAAEVAGPGFASFTRIARSDPVMWADILFENRDALAGPLEATARALADLATALRADDSAAVERKLCAAKNQLTLRPPIERAASKGASSTTHE